MASFSIPSYTASSVTISVSGLTVGSTVRFFVRLASDTSDATVDQSFTATSTAMAKTFTGLKAGTAYAVNVHDGTAWIGAQTFTTDTEKTPYFSITEITDTSVTVSFYDLTVGDTIKGTVKLVSTDIVSSSFVATSSTATRTYSGLNPNTTYKFYMYQNGTQIDYYPFKTLAASVSRPSDWAWYSAIVSGGAVGLSALEWNDFCARINEFRVYAGLSEYSFTVVSKGTAISASICNQARTAISAISGHGTLPSAAVSGGPMYASFFNGLKDALNAIP